MYVLRRALQALFLLSLIHLVPLLDSEAVETGEETSYASLILQYVEQDKVYLLEKLRNRVTRPAEKLLVEAVLTEDGPKAARLYQEQLSSHPDPLLDQLSRSRLRSYAKAVGAKQEKRTSAAVGSFTLQFGSFGSRSNAEEFLQRLAPHIPATIYLENGLHKVRSLEKFSNREQAERIAAGIPFNAFITAAP
ncbi:SPOR domain-containing protein [Prosthecochloris sp. CIB 2401]|nr:SPOR domain-containing protein [Prosthecochloris sp. CIB 2401]ANT64414.1 Sporulation related domain protein [Prosthecochloris sp. CIB 2401]